MLSILTPESLAQDLDPRRDIAETEATEFEFVLGRRQLASVLFVATVVLVVFGAASYLAGKTSLPVLVLPAPIPPAAPPLQAFAQPEREPEPPLFADPAKGLVYLQMGAVDRGTAAIYSEGLRKRGFPSFVAPGPNERIFRVLIGPIPTPQAFSETKAAVDQIGLSTFARKYQQ